MPPSGAEDLITCIYCKERRPPSREHVLQRGIGGDLVARIVCTPCNNGFSAIDGALAERSLVALDRVAFTPPGSFAAKLGGDHYHFDEEAKLWCDISLVNGVQPVLFPQVHLMPGSGAETRLGVLARDRAALQRLRDFVNGKIAANALRTMHVKVGPQDHCNSAHLTMHRDDAGYIRVPREGEEETLFAALEKGWSQAIDANLAAADRGEISQTTVEQPSIRINLKVRLDDVFRAVAKTAFNLTAVKLGTEFVLRPEFDEIRRYIRGEEIKHPPTAPGQVMVDGRFVVMGSPESTPIVPTKEHAVTLAYVAPNLYAWVTLYGHQNFVVRLAQVELHEQVLDTHEFSTIRQGNAALTVQDVYERLTTR